MLKVRPVRTGGHTDTQIMRMRPVRGYVCSQCKLIKWLKVAKPKRVEGVMKSESGENGMANHYAGCLSQTHVLLLE